MKIPINRKFVFDNAVLSNFARINKLELLFYLSKELITTKNVIEEINKGILKKQELSEIITLIDCGRISVGAISDYDNIFLMDDLIQEGILGMGEISAIVLAKEIKGIFITDDEQASKRAVKLGVDILDQGGYRATVIFLELLLKNNRIFISEYNEMIKLLADQSFVV